MPTNIGKRGKTKAATKAPKRKDVGRKLKSNKDRLTKLRKQGKKNLDTLSKLENGKRTGRKSV